MFHPSATESSFFPNICIGKPSDLSYGRLEARKDPHLQKANHCLKASNQRKINAILERRHGNQRTSRQRLPMQPKAILLVLRHPASRFFHFRVSEARIKNLDLEPQKIIDTRLS
jgi:hypothetical protein